VIVHRGKVEIEGVEVVVRGFVQEPVGNTLMNLTEVFYRISIDY
jgi:hypothetical protein